MSEPHGPSHTHCENCGAPLQGPYCHACGQHDLELHGSFRHLAEEALESFFHFDAKWFRGLFDLLFRPGFLSTEFQAGRRIRHIPPLRFYIFTSVVFFGVAMMNRRAVVVDLDVGPRPAGLDASLVNIHINPGARAEKKEAAAKNEPGAKETAKRKVESPRKDGAEEGVLNWFTIHLDTPEARREFSEAVAHRLPKATLLGLPLLALLLAWLFRKPGVGFVQHLVVSMHFHTFAMLWSLFRQGWKGVVGLGSHMMGNVLGSVLFLYTVWYFYVALRRIYGRGRWATLWRGACATGLYWVGLIAILAATVLLTAAEM